MHDTITNGLSSRETVISRALSRALQSWDGLLEALSIGIYTCDRDGILVQYNRRAAELWGRQPETGSARYRFCGALRAFRSDGASLVAGDAPVCEALRTGRPVRDREPVIERPDSARVALLANVDPLFVDIGRLVDAVNCFQDISARREAEQRLREREATFRQLLDALPGAIYTTDALGRITFYNRAAAVLWGCEPLPGSAEWCGSWRLYHPDGSPLPHDQCPMVIALKERRAIRAAEAIAERPDGMRVPFAPFPTPLFDERGQLVGAVKMLVDLTELKESRAALADEARRLQREIAEREQAELRLEVLLDELNHRVKNTLAAVQSIVRQTFRAPDVPPDLRSTFEGRLHALSRTHNQLSRARWESADLRSLLEDIMAPYRGGGDRVLLNGEDVSLAPSTALMLAMVLHELATNAAKYGSLSRPEGRLGVTWNASPADGRNVLRLRWHESGGPPVVPPAHRGFGSQLLERGIGNQLGGIAEIEYDPAGVRCRIEIPLAS